MAVGAVNGGRTPYIQKPSSKCDDVAQLQQQREILQKQLDTIKSKPKNSPAEKDAAAKEIEQLQKQINEIDKKIQKASQNQKQSQNASKTSAVSSKKRVLSKSNSRLGSVQSEHVHNGKKDEIHKNDLSDVLKAEVKLLDVYA